MRPVRILTIGHSYVVAGNRAIMARVAREPGVELTIAAPKFHHGDLRPIFLEPDPAGVDYRLVGLPAYLTRKIHVFFYGGLGDLVRSGQFDLVHGWVEPYILSGFQIARAARRNGAKFVFQTCQNIDKRYPPPFDRFERYCAQNCAGWVGIGELVRQVMLKRGYPDRVAEVIPLSIDEDHFRPDPAAREAVRSRLGLDGPVIGFVGRLNEDKGLDVLMTALEGVPGPWNLLALGSGPYESKLKAWAEARGWSDRLRVMLVKHDEVPAHLQAMDLLVAPSQTRPNWREQFGRMIVESFACRVPVIGSDSGEIPFVIGDAGLVCPERDPAAWTSAISELLASPDLRRALADAGEQRCHERYTAARAATQWLDVYRRCLDDLPGSARS